LPDDDTVATKGRENDDGASAKLTWRERNNTLVAGFDYDHLDIDGDPNLGQGVKLFSDKYGVFLNDTLVIGDFAVTPGFRYDRMRPVGGFFSPSLGVAWNPTDKITLRTYAARGYSLPSLNRGSTQNKVITLQTGFESTYIPWLWLKTTFFWNWLSDVQDLNAETNDGPLGEQRRHGVELEARTVPVFNTSLSAGYTFTNGRDRVNQERLVPFPRQLVKLGVHYNDVQHSLRGALLGRYVCGDSQWSTNAKTSAMILDLNLAKKVFTWRDTGVELFFNAHNIFNGAQDTLDNGFKHTPRWFEGGLSFDF
jgi:vitamin B12 transporter